MITIPARKVKFNRVIECMNLSNTILSNTKRKTMRRFGFELESYRDKKHRDEVIVNIEKDASVGQFFGQVMGLLTQGYSCIMGELSRLQV